MKNRTGLAIAYHTTGAGQASAARPVNILDDPQLCRAFSMNPGGMISPY